MRLVVGCTLEPPEIEAIERGEELRDLVERRFAERLLAPPDAASMDALELLSWMVGRGFLDVRVAVPCDTDRKPVPADGLFHEKAGIIEDRGGNRIAWNGSLNETEAGWKHNWEAINVYTSWGPQPQRVAAEEANFARIWANRAHRVIVLDVPDAARQDLMRFMPDHDVPARLKEPPRGLPAATKPYPKTSPPPATREPAPPPFMHPGDPRSRVWSFIRCAPALPDGGRRVGEATAAVVPWPHQARAFEQLYRDWPPKLLIADEVGLGKTIQAGLLLRQAWLSGRAKRILILAPKAVTKQWQVELREKFNLNWPIYDGRKLVWYPSPAWRGCHERVIDPHRWHEEPVVIASSQLMRRSDRIPVLLEAIPWDLVVLDEAHHARRRAAGTQQEGGPNALLRLMQGLKDQTKGLVLLTATPMQVHPIEVWDLLNLLGLPVAWSSAAFLDFFKHVEHPNPSPEAWEDMARLFQSAEDSYGEVAIARAQRLTDLSRLKARKILRALRDRDTSIPRRRLETAERRAAVTIMRSHTPIRHLISRHTRELLRRYFKAGTLATPIADRRVEDRFLAMTPGERVLYDAVERYVASTYNQASAGERTAVGFVMTIYRRRLASSFRALRNTLERHLRAVATGGQAQSADLEEDLPDDETVDEFPDAEEAAKIEREALATEEEADVKHLLDHIDQLPPDSKLHSLRDTLHELLEDDYSRIMVFTQYTDTMDFLREALLARTECRLMCFSGRGGEIPSADGSWRSIDRDDAKRRFRDAAADVLLCTDAAAEGLNFQFCGALINYDMPWNPMKVEQRIGRIDRLGQRHRVIRIVNLHYEDTVETDVYRALRARIGLFEAVVGPLQPIVARLPRMISRTVLSGGDRDARERAHVVDAIKQEVREAEGRGFDLDAVTEEDLVMPKRPLPAVTMDDLDRIIGSPDLMPPGTGIQPLGHREYGLWAPGMRESLRVTTDPEYFEKHAESVELWSPGNILFQAPDTVDASAKPPSVRSLEELLDG